MQPRNSILTLSCATFLVLQMAAAKTQATSTANRQANESQVVAAQSTANAQEQSKLNSQTQRKVKAENIQNQASQKQSNIENAELSSVASNDQNSQSLTDVSQSPSSQNGKNAASHSSTLGVASETNTANSSAASTSSNRTQENEKVLNQIVTNQRLAAMVGIARPLSARITFSYNGGSIQEPFGRIRPNYRKLPGNPFLATNMTGTLGMAYRINPQLQARLAGSFAVITPLHNTWDEWRENRRVTGDKVYNFNNVGVDLNHITRRGRLMISSGAGASIPLLEHWINNVGLLGSVSADVTLIADLAPSKWQPMVTFSVSHSLYRDGNMFDRNNLRRFDVGWGIYPAVEYQFNSLFSFRTVFGFFNYTKYRDQSWGQWYRDGNYISSGIGITPKRGIWFYPNVQFNPDDIRADLTNVGLSAAINL